MAKCRNCGSPLPHNTNLCVYCGTRNDIDLRSVHRYTTHEPESDRICPRCEKKMLTIDLEINGTFLIEQCTQCYGIFFDPNELETLLDLSVSNVFSIDMDRIGELTMETPVQPNTVAYLKCPVCRKLMNRTNFGNRSGVIADQCGSHGIWLDSGELRRLFEWRKAGGELLHHRKEQEIESDNDSLRRSRDNLKKFLDRIRERSARGMY